MISLISEIQKNPKNPKTENRFMVARGSGCKGLVFQLLTGVRSCDPMDYSTPGFPSLPHLLELAQTHVHWVSGTHVWHTCMPFDHAFLCRPLLFPPSTFPSIRVFSNESVLRIRWPKYWSVSFSISPYNEYLGLISFIIDWSDLLAVWGTLKSLLQHHSSKSLILWHSAFVMVQLSHPYMTTRKTIALTRWTFVSKVMSLLFNMLSRYVIAFLPRSKCLLISRLQSPSAVTLEPKKIKSATISILATSSTVSPICHEVMEPDAMILVFWLLSF